MVGPGVRNEKVAHRFGMFKEWIRRNTIAIETSRYLLLSPKGSDDYCKGLFVPIEGPHIIDFLSTWFRIHGMYNPSLSRLSAPSSSQSHSPILPHAQTHWRTSYNRR